MESNGPLISPCRCSGSLKYIHEDCLKAWLASKLIDKGKAKCEICKTRFLMDFVMASKCYPSEAFKCGVGEILLLQMILIVLILNIIIIFVAAKRLESDTGFAVTLINVCCFSGVFIIVLVAKYLRKACMKKHLKNWRIFSQRFDDDDQLGTLEKPRRSTEEQNKLANGSSDNANIR